MAQLIQIIDKRIARFSSKNSPLKPIVSSKDTRNVKLKPIEILNATKPKDPAPVTRARRVKLHASNILKNNELAEDFDGTTVENSNTSNFQEFSNLSDDVENVESIENSFNLEKDEKKQEDEDILKESEKEKISEGSSEDIEVERVSFEQVQEFWTRVKKSVGFCKFSERFHWVLYKVWRAVMKRGVNKMQSKWLLKNKSIKLIQKTIKMFLSRSKYRKIKSSAKIIQRFWSKTRPHRKYFLAVKTISKFISPLYKLRFFQRNSAAIRIQKFFKGRQVFRQYRPLIRQKIEIQRHKNMLERQATLKKERNVKKNAAKFIEEQWLDFKARIKLRDVRKYLWTLPYECRILYFKFQQVKKDADNLKNDVDQLIAKKQGKLNS